ncbi:MAG: MFS transporter [Ktedonobacteraceae bacterium]|nr:MFS transporter [Ktedonobacteraceae bacterium]
MLQRLIASKLKPASPLRLALYCAPLLDEMTIGFLAIGLPLASRQLKLDYTQVGLLFTIGALASMLLDPLISLLSDRHSKRYWILGGSLFLGAAFAFVANIHAFALLACAFVLIYLATTAVALSQVLLIDQNPQESSHTMTRWTLMASIGDLLGPIIVSLIIVWSSGWSILCWIACIAWLTMACVIGFQRFPQTVHNTEGVHDNEEAHASPVRLLDGLREALHDARLLRWTILSLIPSMLDEVFIVYATFYLRDVISVNTSVIGVLLALHMIGGFLGLFLLDRVLLQRMTPERLLICLALLVIIGMIGFLTLHSAVWAGVMLFLIGLGVAGLYPIATAEAYKQFPGRSGTVLAVMSLGAPFEVALPYVTGFVASRFGVVASLCLLGTAPLLILILKPGKK